MGFSLGDCWSVTDVGSVRGSTRLPGTSAGEISASGSRAQRLPVTLQGQSGESIHATMTVVVVLVMVVVVVVVVVVVLLLCFATSSSSPPPFV